MLCHLRGHGRDTRGRFGIKFDNDSISANCFNCGFGCHWSEGEMLSTSFKFLLTSVGADENLLKSIEFEIYRNKHNLNSSTPEDIANREAKYRSLFTKWSSKELPTNSLPLVTWLEAGCDDTNLLTVADYTVSRGIYNLNNLYWCPEEKHEMNKRLIVPYYYKGRLVGIPQGTRYICRIKLYLNIFKYAPKILYIT
jgi:hypothetical protein